MTADPRTVEQREENVREAALRHHALGRVVVPIPPQAKGPRTPGWQKQRPSERALGEIQLRANIGLLLGAASRGLVDVDLDCPEARAVAAVLLPPTAMRHGRASSPESHYWYSVAAPPRNGTKYLDPVARGSDEKACLVELRSGSDESGAQTMIPPSVHPSGERLTWIGGRDGGPAHVEISDLQRSVAMIASVSLLARYYPAQGARHDYALALAGMLLAGGMAEDAVSKLVYEIARVGGSDAPDGHAGNVVSTTVQRLAAGEAVAAGSHLAEILGDDGTKIIRAVTKWLVLRPAKSGRSSTARKSGNNSERELTNSYLSVLTVVRQDRAGVVGGKLALDEMRRTPTLDGRELGEVDLLAMRARIEERIEANSKSGWLEARISDLHGAVLQIASERPYHPVRAFLSSLTWDRTPRIERVPSEILRAEDTAINRTILRRWFVSAVARPFSPGAKVDTVLVLVGEQGALKSTFFGELAGAAWFCDSALDIHSKDAYATMQRSWIVEWSELESLRRARDAEAVKAFLSSRADSYRPPYGRVDVRVERTSIIVGTTNRPEFLDDETGNRRWWPVRTGTLDIDRLREWREQLWAEAVALYREGERWWLTLDEEAALAPARVAHATTDPWTDIVLAWAVAPIPQPGEPHGTPSVTTANVLRCALDKPVGQWTRADENRVGKILTRAGYAKTGERVGGKGGQRLWRRRE